MSYLRKSDLGNDDGVHGAGSVAERLGGVTVRVVLVLVDLTVLLSSVPRHSALADADIALGVDRGGLAAEVPTQRERNWWLVIMLVCIPNGGGIGRIAAGFAAIVGEARQEKITTGIIHHPAIRKAPDITPRRTCVLISPSAHKI